MGQIAVFVVVAAADGPRTNVGSKSGKNPTSLKFGRGCVAAGSRIVTACGKGTGLFTFAAADFGSSDDAAADAEPYSAPAASTIPDIPLSLNEGFAGSGCCEDAATRVGLLDEQRNGVVAGNIEGPSLEP